jgi:hypothetical protein
MKKTGAIFLILWIFVRIAFHLVKTDSDPDSISAIDKIVYQLYFIASSFWMVGLFAILNSLAKYIPRIEYMPRISFRKFTLCLFIYASWCAFVDVLMIFGVGNKDSLIYTGVSIILLFISIIWLYVSKP